ncbi:MAG: NAD(P)/FAD-dependent oxidoreductase [Candidatus Sericytochromatia bacterium]
MKTRNAFDVIIIGGSYSGLAAAMALGRALKTVLVIDSFQPCNLQTPHSHNFLTQDGKPPAEIASLARQQVEQYDSVHFYTGLAVKGTQSAHGFAIETDTGEVFETRKLIFATGIKDILPEIPGFAACWGISALHCPYCHGYEVKNQTTGIFGNGEYGFEFAMLISNWTPDLTLLTHGKSRLTEAQQRKLEKHQIRIIETELARIEHANGFIHHVYFKDGSNMPVKALYTRPDFVQHCPIPESLGCELTSEGYLKTDPLQKTTVAGIYACGDNCTRMRTVANAVAMGTTAGMMLNKELVIEAF